MRENPDLISSSVIFCLQNYKCFHLDSVGFPFFVGFHILIFIIFVFKVGKTSSLEENDHSTEGKSWLNRSLDFPIDLTFRQLR